MMPVPVPELPVDGTSWLPSIAAVRFIIAALAEFINKQNKQALNVPNIDFVAISTLPR
jgi:hypothetical protein